MPETLTGLALFAIGLTCLAHSSDTGDDTEDDTGGVGRPRGTLQERRRFFSERDELRLWAMGTFLIWLGVVAFAQGMTGFAE